ncbi:MAG: SRPBCC domain-containing protein [Usitatibacter sp.]
MPGARGRRLRDGGLGGSLGELEGSGHRWVGGSVGRRTRWQNAGTCRNYAEHWRASREVDHVHRGSDEWVRRWVPRWGGTFKMSTVTLKAVMVGTEVTIVQEGAPEAIPVEMCYLGWQESLAQLAHLVEPEIPG